MIVLFRTYLGNTLFFPSDFGFVPPGYLRLYGQLVVSIRLVTVSIVVNKLCRTVRNWPIVVLWGASCGQLSMC